MNTWPWGAWALSTLLTAAWLAVGGLVYLGVSGGVIEALCIEIAALVLALVATGLFVWHHRRSA